MGYVDISISFLVAMLGIAYPVILQVITRLDERYESDMIMELFEKEPLFKAFRSLLLISLMLTLLYLANQYFGAAEQVIRKSGIFLAISTALLLLVFTTLVEKMITYFTPRKLIRYLERKYDSHSQRSELFLLLNDNFARETYFDTLKDLLISSIERKESRIAYEISYFMQQLFEKHRQNDHGPFPGEYYTLLNTIVKHSLQHHSPQLEKIQQDVTSGHWLLGKYDYRPIHPDTYNALWRNLVLMAKYNRDDLIYSYWNNAMGHYCHQLSPVEPQYDHERMEIINRQTVEARDKERSQFLEFHLAIGGMLLYYKRHALLHKLLAPASANAWVRLLPDTLTGIFHTFHWFSDYTKSNFEGLKVYLSFPEEEAWFVYESKRIFHAKFIGILYLRHLAIENKTFRIEKISRPGIPRSQVEKKSYIDNLDELSTIVDDLLKEEELLKDLGYAFITPAWFEQKSQDYPSGFFSWYKSLIQNKYEHDRGNAVITPEQVTIFKDVSNKILSRRIDSLQCFANTMPFQPDYEQHDFTGRFETIDKHAFIFEEGAHHLNYDRYFSSVLADDLVTHMSNSFLSRVSNKYTIGWQSLSKAIKRLKLDPAVHVILNFGFDSGAYLSAGNYKGIPVIDVAHFDKSPLSDSLLVLRKDQLPWISHYELEAPTISEFHLELLNEQIQVYGSVIDLGKHPELVEKATYDDRQITPGDYVMICIAFFLSVSWAPDAHIVQLESTNTDATPVNKIRRFDLLQK